MTTTVGHTRSPKRKGTLLYLALITLFTYHLYREWTYFPSGLPTQKRESRGLLGKAALQQTLSEASPEEEPQNRGRNASDTTADVTAEQNVKQFDSSSSKCPEEGFQCRRGNASRDALANEHVVRALVMYLPYEKFSKFKLELLGLFRSWLNMLEAQRPLWRMDFVIVTDNTSVPSLAELGCTTEHRNDELESDKCVLMEYVPLQRRSTFQSELERSRFEGLKNYGYTDSVLFVAELEMELAQSYDYIMRTDLDTFLLPSLGKFIPNGCQMIAGRGAYHNSFNQHKLAAVAKQLGYRPSNLTNWGSTWYGPPTAVSRAINRTLSVMEYLQKHEFTTAAKEGKHGVLDWPEWHFGVILLYGGHVVLGHLYESRCAVEKAPTLMDWPSQYKDNCETDDHVHIHMYHTEDRFSKFVHKRGGYQNFPLESLNLSICADYATYMALDGERKGSAGLGHMYREYLELHASKLIEGDGLSNDQKGLADIQTS